MTYRARDRSITEVIIAVILVSFLTGFVFVLCIGNYYRAKRAMERQRQRRLAKLAGQNGNGIVDSPRSNSSSDYSDTLSERRSLLLKRTPNQRSNILPHAMATPGSMNPSSDLLFHVEEQRPTEF
mmetsp:Transcript_14768/g.21784  ORF Transcript_14768/g.21784 Transcript_14768/m.21784 type:complete len:125 (-) Transcript_14768:1171-1545(-)